MAASEGGLELAQWKQLIDTLVPPDTLELVDAVGGTYTVCPKLPARLEMKLINKLLEIGDLPAGAEMKAKFLAMGSAKGRGGQVGAMLDMARQLIGSNDRILGLLGEAFVIAYGEELVEKAVANVREKQPRLLKDIEAPTPADVFPTGELLGAIVPFAAGLVKGAMDKFTSLPTPPIQ